MRVRCPIPFSGRLSDPPSGRGRRRAGVDTGRAGGPNTLLFAVGAAVIGSTSLFGGRGRAVNALLGGLVVATIRNGLGLLGFDAYLTFLVT